MSKKVKRTMPELIPDTPENVAKAILNTPPKKREEWDFIKEDEAKKKEKK